MTYDALIIGGGPAGATAAFILARAGWSVGVAEKAVFPRRKVCGEFISATTMPLLRDIGLLGAFLDMAGPEIRRVGLLAGNSFLSSPMPPARSETPWGRALGRESLDTLLLAAAVRAGAQLWQPWAVTALNRTGGQYHCVLAGKAGTKEITARLVIAAHGSWEQSALTIDRRPHGPADLLAFKARFRNCALPPDLMPLLVFPGGYGGMVTSDDSQVTLSCCIRRDRLRQCRDSAPGFAAAEAVLRHIRRSSRAVDHVLADAKLDGRWLSAGPICPGMRPGYAEGVFRIGNAAGEAHPIIADGISMAIQSAWLLCRCLLAEQGQILPRRQHGETARAYGPEWRKAFGRRIRAAAIFAHLAMRTDAAAVFVPLLRVVPGILTIGARLSGKVAPIEWLRHSPAWP